MTHPEAGAERPDTGESAELASLLGQASVALDLQCRAAHFELRQTQRLLSDATRRLLDCFHAAVRELADQTSGTPAARAGANLLAASQHMQFSDLVSQLLNSTEERVDGLLRVSERLQELLRAMSAPQAAALLPHEKHALLEALAELEDCGSTRVHQSDMNAGDAELF
jgi:hypothetical protein